MLLEYQFGERRRRADAGAVEGGDDVSGAEAAAGRRRPGEHVLDERAFAALALRDHSEQAGRADVDRARALLFADLAGDRLHLIDWDREPLIGRGLELEGRRRGGVHAEDFARAVDERPARVARLQIGAQLDQAAEMLLGVVKLVTRGDRLVERAHLSSGCAGRPAGAAGVADRRDALPDLQRAR